MKFKKILIWLVLFFSPVAFAGFCDSTGQKKSVNSVHVHGSTAYVSIDPGLGNSADAASATIKNEVAFALTESDQKNIMPLFLTAFAAGKKVVLTYCDGTMVHGYKGDSNTVTIVTSVSLQH